MKRKQKEQLLNNKFGKPSRNQMNKIKELKALKNLPIVDSSMISKEPYQLTLAEFTAVHSERIIEKVAPALFHKSW